MPIRYSCINDGTTLLAEYPADGEPTLASTMQKVLATVPSREYRRKTIEDKDGGVNYNYISNGEGRIVACVSTADMRMRTIFAFLEAVEPLVRGNTDVPGSHLRNGRKLLQQKMEFFNNPQNDKITALSDDINQVVDVMMDNMDKVLARGERIDVLQEKSSTLADQAQQFQQRSTALKRNLCMKNIKLMMLIILAVIIVVAIVALIIYLKVKK